MVTTLFAAAIAAIVRYLTATLLQRINIGAPLLMVALGAVTGLTVSSSVGAVLNTTVAQHVAEIVLAILLFLDASELRDGRLWGRSPALSARLLLIALPLSLVLAVAAGSALFPSLTVPALLVLACVVMPVDFAATETVLRDGRVAPGLRSSLNVEGGFNDGILSPLFLFALALAGTSTLSTDPSKSAVTALTGALPQAAIAVAVGLSTGALLSAAIHITTARGWSASPARRVVVLLAPLVAYAAAVATNGNGFVAAFVCGILFRFTHTALAARRAKSITEHTPSGISLTTPRRPALGDYGLLEEVTSVLTTAVWFVVGIAGVYMITAVDLRVATFCLLALTLLRVIPVLLALTGSSLVMSDRLLAGFMGPRGITTIVFGLLAFNKLPDGYPSNTILIVTVVCVLGSVLLHGLGGSAIIDRLSTSGSRSQMNRLPD